MNKKFKEALETFKDNVKEVGKDIKESIVDFGEDTMDYIEDHTWVLPVLAFSGLKLIQLGVNLAQKGNIECRKEGISQIYTNKWQKLNRNMSFDEWFDYLEEMYKCNFKKQKQVKYLKENGFID